MKLDSTKRALVIAHDIKLVKALSGNDPKLRERALKSLQKWFEHRSQKIPFTEEEFMRIWKGLFYAMWMSDKPLVQEECAEKISNLIHNFTNVEISLLFFKCSLTVLATEWFGIDQLRLDKFLMFVRRILRQALFVLRNSNWQLVSISRFGEILFETILQRDDNNHMGLTMHITEIYLEELAKVTRGEIKPLLLTLFLKPFVKQLATLNDARSIAHTKKYLFHHLLQQSDKGIEYQVKFQAWKGEGFPGGTIDSMQNVRDVDNETEYSDEENEVANQPLDPRAGEVNVVLPQLVFNGKQIAKLLLEFKFENGSNMKSRKAISELAKKFQQLSKGKFPLGIKKIELPDDNDYSTNIKKSVNRLIKFENRLLGNNRKRALKDKRTNSSVTPPKKAKTDDTSNSKPTDFFQKKLQNFINKSEAKTLRLRKRKRTKRISNIVTIQRNSGTWLVESFDSAESSYISDVDRNPIDENSTPTMAFPQNEWDVPPKEGEVEIFIPSNKYKKKIDNMAKTSVHNSLLLKRSLEKLAKPRRSLPSHFVANPFSRRKFFTPQSEKKVKINLNLNSSQEIHEHHAQIRQSPAIPFDANRKPAKPLLKSSFNSPINPFSKRLL